MLNARTINSQYRRYTASGYFDDIEELIKASHSIIQASGIYVTLHPCHRGLVTRANNLIRTSDDMRVDDRTTKDEEIIAYKWLYVDVDPVRQNFNDSSSDEEHEAALQLARYIHQTLKADGWSESLLADSGNGAHILYPLDLPNTEASKKQVESILKKLAERFSTDTAKVDTSVFNASRIIKLYGTRSCKGYATEEWPHRMSAIIGGELS